MRITLPNGKWRKRLKIKALPPFAELHKVRAGNYKIFHIILILTGFFERDWILLTGFRVTLRAYALRVKVNDRPIRYFYGEACHNFSLNERAKGRSTTQRRAGLPVRNRIGENGKLTAKAHKNKLKKDVLVL